MPDKNKIIVADVIALAVGVVFSKVRFTKQNIPVIPLLNKELSLNAPVLILTNYSIR